MNGDNGNGSGSSNNNGRDGQRRAGGASTSQGGVDITSTSGHKIAYDPKDIEERSEEKILPKLTLMEECLLLGLKGE